MTDTTTDLKATALRHLQQAQGALNAACAELAELDWSKSYQTASDLGDAVRDLYRRVDSIQP